MLQLLQVSLGEGIDAFEARGSEGESDEALVVGVSATFEEAEFLGPVDEADGAVVADQEGPSDVGDGRAPRVVVAPDGQEELMLGRRHVELGRLLLAEAAEAAQGDPELEDPGELLVGERAAIGHAADLRRCPNATRWDGRIRQ